MSEWKEYKLSEVMEIIGGGTPKTSVDEYWDGNIPWLSVVDFNTGKKFVYETEKSITKNGLENSSTKILQKGDIIISARGTVGVLSVLGKEMAFNQSCYGIRNIPNRSNNDFIYYLLKDTVDNFIQVAHGGVFDTITRSTFDNIKVQVPFLPKQKATATVLSSLDDKIDLLHRQNETLEAMAETLFRQWFVERRPELVEGEAEEDWEEKPLGEILTVTSSKRIYYKEYVPSGVPFYRSKEIIELSESGSTDGDLFISEKRFLEVSEERGAPQEGDILLTSVGTLGVPYRVRKNDQFYFKDGNLTWFKDFDKVPSIIIYTWLKSDLGQGALRSITIGSTQAALTITGLKKILFLVPPPEVIDSIKSELTQLQKKIDSNQRQIKTLEKLRDTLLPKLMSGEVEVKN